MYYTFLRMFIGRKQMKLSGILGSASLAVLAMAAGGAHAADKYVVGVSNTLTGNGWREEMICSIKALRPNPPARFPR
jgi:ABC-type sugar transport system substrate-binding protein